MNDHRRPRWAPAFAPVFCVAVHIIALVAMAVVLRGGMLSEPDVERRARYIADHSLGWTLGWGIWMLAGLSLVLFYAWWAYQLMRDRSGRVAGVERSEPPVHFAGGALRSSPATLWLAFVGVLLAAVGMLCDWTGESISALALVESAISPDAGFKSFLTEERTATLLTAGAANFLYTLGGLLLMFATPDLPRRVRAAMWGTWIAGFVMSVSGLLMYVPGIVAATVVLFPLLLLWVAWMGCCWRRS